MANTKFDEMVKNLRAQKLRSDIVEAASFVDGASKSRLWKFSSQLPVEEFDAILMELIEGGYLVISSLGRRGSAILKATGKPLPEPSTEGQSPAAK